MRTGRPGRSSSFEVSHAALAVGAAVLLGACGAESGSPDGVALQSTRPEAVNAAPAAVGPGDARVFETPEDFEAGYWVRPIPPQGPPPESWSDLEASLRPESCAACHPVQFEDWSTTVHSDAYSPGLSGQLVNWEESAFGTVQSCLVCHAPLSEQSALLPDGGEWEQNSAYDPTLRDHGIVCAACHLRGNRRHGALKRDGSAAPSPDDSPHGGVTRTEFFEDSRFCAGCHQFEPGGAAPNGKPLENTYAEWQESRYAAAGTVCQTCHMPDRRHLWRGIHDPDMVRSGITVEWLREAGRAGLRVTNTGTGHRFPTYATPEVFVRVELLDSDSRPIEGAAVEHSIARRIAYQGGVWIELSDSRLPPDGSVEVAIPVPEQARHVRAEIVVRPDAFYLDVFQALLAGMLSDTSRTLLTEARELAESSPFVVFGETVPLER